MKHPIIINNYGRASINRSSVLDLPDGWKPSYVFSYLPPKNIQSIIKTIELFRNIPFAQIK